jgi:hypothetical protein
MAQQPSELQILTTQLGPGEVAFVFRASAGTTAAYQLEYSKEPGVDPWFPVRETWVEAEPGPECFKIRARAGAGASAYYRVAQWPGAWVPVVLNEVMPNNTKTVADEDGDFVDWVEFYNHGDTPIDLTGFALSDDSVQPLKWTFPDVASITAGGYLTVFLSGKDREGHASFRLGNGTEPILFSNPSGTVLDQIVTGPLRSDDSLGRHPENVMNWHEFDGTPAATPGEANIPTSGSLPSPHVQSPTFTVEGGFFNSPVTLSFQAANPVDAVHYTLDGSEPDDETSPFLTEPLVIDRTAVVRAMTLTGDGNKSEPHTMTYFVGANHSLPVISISADPDEFEFRDGRLYGFGDRLFSNSGRIIGSFPWSNSNAWQGREINANIELFEPDKSEGFNHILGIKIFGGWGSRGYPQKSFAVFARSRRGVGRIQHQLFPDKDIRSFEGFVLRNSGNDNQSTYLTVPRSEIRAFSKPEGYGSYFVNGNFTLFRDAMLGSLARDIGLDTQGYRPSVVYINGDYWGIYNIREKFNEHYVESNHGVPHDEVDVIEGYGSANAGRATEYSRMRSYISGRNMNDPERYQFVQDNYLYIDNFIDYHLAVIFFQNFDIGNIKCWRPQVEGGKFRWMVYDQDYGFHLWKPDVYLPAMKRDFSDYDNMFRFYTNANGSGTGWPNQGGRTVLLRKMLDNDGFRERFILRCADLLNTTFETDYVTDRINVMASVIRSEIPAHLNRWSWAEIEKRGFGHPHKVEDEPLTQVLWEAHVQGMRDYAAARPAKLRQDLLSHFRLEGETGEVKIAVEPAGAGAVKVSSISVAGTPAGPWAGIYFEDFPPPLTPAPAPGWRLASWEGDLEETDGVTSAIVNAAAPSTVTALYEVATLAPENAAISISEIQYNPADRQLGGEWLELLDTGDAEIDLSGWKIYDSQDSNEFVIPEDTRLAAGARLVVARDPVAFAVAYPDISTVVSGGFSFNFSNGGELVRLVDSTGAIVEAVTYDDRSPWPEMPDGGGFTLERTDLLGNPALAASWSASEGIGGTPGK